MQPADVPVGQIEQKWELKMTIEDGHGPFGSRTSPFAHFHLSWPVSGLASAAVSPSHAVRTVVFRGGSSFRERHLLTVAGAAQVSRGASCFPFNCTHGYVCGHQNGVDYTQSSTTISPWPIACGRCAASCAMAAGLSPRWRAHSRRIVPAWQTMITSVAGFSAA